MCGRFSNVQRMKAMAQRFKFDLPSLTYDPRYNIAPTQNVPTVIEKDGRQLKMMRWGLIPSWAKDKAIGYKMINARAETVAEKPSFRKPFQRSRCLVLADGYYEWKVVEGQKYKTPMRIVLTSREPFAFAGLYDKWAGGKDEIIESFTIITTLASSSIKHVHDRMPVILKEKDESLWLDPGYSNTENLKSLLVPFESENIKAYEVSRLVNSPTNDKPEVLNPAKN